MFTYTPTPSNPELDRAKQIVTEIIRCAGGKVESKTRLFKIFYFAHLIYAKKNPDYLSEWPIVRMPHGPGIGDANEIFLSLKRDGLLDIRQTTVGPYPAYEYRTTGATTPELSPNAIDAIRQAVSFAEGKPASELSELAHEFSNAWKNSKDGQTLDIYVDLITEEAYLDMQSRVQEDLDDLRAVVS